MGRYLVAAGLGLVLLGAIVWILEKAGFRLGRLPGDIAIQRDGFSLMIPIGTMVLASLVFSALLWLVGMFRR